MKKKKKLKNNEKQQNNWIKHSVKMGRNNSGSLEIHQHRIAVHL